MNRYFGFDILEYEKRKLSTEANQFWQKYESTKRIYAEQGEDPPYYAEVLKESAEKSRVSLDNVTALIEKYAAMNTKDSTYFTYEMLDEFYNSEHDAHLRSLSREIKEYADALSGIVVSSGIPFVSLISGKIAREIISYRKRKLIESYFAEEALAEIWKLGSSSQNDLDAVHEKYKYFMESFKNSRVLSQLIMNL